MFSAIFERHQTNWDILYKKDTGVIDMKVTNGEKEQLSNAIDRMNEGLDAFIQLYNEAENDEPLIQFEDETADLIRHARDSYGQEQLDEKLNTIIKQILSISLLKEEPDE